MHKVSILMLTYNAPEYVEISIRSLAANTLNVPYSLVVVDNASEPPTRDLVQKLRDEGLIHHLELLDYNSLFAKGNNIAASLSPPDSSHFLLLNSDVEVKHPDWLKHLLEIHRPGATGYGVVNHPPVRADGYCLLIDAPLYLQNKLDESHQWWWGVTKLQAALLAKGYSVQAYLEHEKYLHHFGGKSGDGFKGASGMAVTPEEVLGWFGGLEKNIRVIDKPAGAASVAKRIARKLFG